MKKLIVYILLLFPFFMGCKGEFADQNSNPSVVANPDIRYLFTRGLEEFKPAEYLIWFYNNPYYLTWTQATVGDRGGANSKTLNRMGTWEQQHITLIKMKSYTEEIKHVLSTYDAYNAGRYENIRVMCNPLLVYLGIFGTDIYGSIPYTEASIVNINPTQLTPKYETQQELIDIWLQQLNETVEVLGKDLPNQESLGGQDFIYKGDRVKWLKFANSLKLKIAVRLLHVDKARAIKIAKEVESSSAGILTSFNDDFIYNKGTQDYNFGNELWIGAGSKHLLSFLVENKDPRVRFLFQKNDFNSRVVQAFLDKNVQMPTYIKNAFETEIVAGKTVFKEWKAPGEPWVRYSGAPVNVLAADTAAVNNDYFNKDKFKLSFIKDGKEGLKEYTPLSMFNEELTRGGKTYFFPDAPEASVVKDDRSNPWHGLFFSAAEAHFYLAELALLSVGDANQLVGAPETYFAEGVRLSVQSLDNLAAKNKIPYYESKYDPNETVIALQAGEIDHLLTQPAYQLTGSRSEKLEKIYIQQYIHFLNIPNESFVSVRRSGIPKRGSSILAWQEFTSGNDASFPIPRRFEIAMPLESDLMYQIKFNAFKAQGFSLSTGNNPETLNKERVWYDKAAPNFGEGPNF